MLSARNIVLGLCIIALACGAERRSAFEAPKPEEPKEETPPLPGPIEPSAEAGSTTPACTDTPIKPAGSEATIAAEYAPHYTAYELGAVPGVPGPLGGCAIDPNDPNRLLIAGESEQATAAIYAIKVKRGDCKHITGFDGTATLVASAPNVDANLVFTAKGLLLYTRWPTVGFGELLPGATSPSREIDLKALGMAGGGAGGLGFVPPGLDAEGELRAVTWPEGVFHHLYTEPDGNLLHVGGAQPAQPEVKLEGGPGGFAYVPAGSPGFPEQRLVVAEWDVNSVATYAVDQSGDPIASTRKAFFTSFPRPWGAYFEPLTGDFIFLTWGANGSFGADDRVYIVQGFTPPPPPPDPK